MEYKSLKMKDLPQEERPYEKLENAGAEMLSNAELLAIIIKTGTKSETAVSLANRILLQSEGRRMTFLHDLSLDDLKSIHGIGRVKAIQIKAVLELSKRMASNRSQNSKTIIRSPEDASRLVMEELRYMKKEVFKLLLLNTKNHLLRQTAISVGSLNASIVHPREVFHEVLKTPGCAGIILVHNHPSGDPDPSREDIETTKRLADAGDILGMKVLDHIIIGDGVFTSLKEKGLM